MTRRSWRRIIYDVSQAFDVPVRKMTSKSKSPSLVRARWAAMKLIRDEQHRSYPEIARYVGRKDHTTAMYGIAKADALLASDPDFAGRFEAARSL